MNNDIEKNKEQLLAELNTLRKKSKDQRDKLFASNQQLEASNQQLQASEQQLRAANQQLAASEQQLKAANQHLQASDQQLRAANLQLIDDSVKLKQSEARFMQLVETASDAIYLMNEDGMIIDTNHTATQMLLKTKDEIINKPINTVDPSFPVKDFVEFWKSIPFEQQKIFTTTHVTKKGDLIPVEVSGKKFKIDKEIYYFGVARDITERLKAEKDIKRQKDFFELVINSAPTRIFWKDLNSVYLGCNTAFAFDAGIEKPEDIIGKTDDDLIWKSDADKYRADDRSVLQSGKPKTSFEEGFINKNGEHIIWRTNKQPLRNKAGAIVGVIAASENITEIKKATEKIEESERKLKFIIDNSTNLFYVHSAENEITFISPQIREILGYEPEEVLQYWTDFITDNPINEKAIKFTNEAIATGKRQPTYELELLRKDGNKIIVEVKESPVIENGKVVSLVGSLTDVTERRKAELALSKNQYHLTKAQEIGKIGTWELDILKNELIWNEQNYKNFGVSVGIPSNYELFLSCVHPEDREYVNNKWTDAMNGRQYDIEHRVVVDGDVRWLREKAEVTFDNKGKAIKAIGFTQDITEQKQAESKLHMLNKAIDHSLNAFDIINQEGEFIYVNQAYVDMWGYNTIEDVLGTSPVDHFEDPKMPEQIIKELRKNGQFVGEFKAKRKNGSLFDVLMYARLDYDENGNEIYPTTSLDITERNISEMKIKESEKLLSTIAENFPNSYLSVINSDLTVGFTSGQELKKQNLDPKQFEGMKLDQIFGDKTEFIIGKYKRTFRGEEQTFEMFFNDQHQLYKTVPLYADDGSVPRILSVAENITARRLSEVQLRKLSLAVEQNPSIVAITNIDGDLEYINPTFTNITGYSQEEIIGHNSRILKSVEQPIDMYKELWETISSGKTWRGEFHNKRKNGEMFWESASVSPIFDEEGKIINYIKISEDISRQKRDEQTKKIIHNISNAVITSQSLENFIELVQAELETIIDATNFFVALYDETTKSFSLPLHYDEKDVAESFPSGKTLTNYVVKTKKPLLATKAIVEKLKKSGEIEIIGNLSEVWLGVPLKSKNKIIGVLAIQNYKNENAFNESDVKILEIISYQISLSLERIKAEEDLKIALEKAKESDRLKSAFLSNMSHEIRTPMNGILGFTGLLKEPQLTGETKEKYIQIIEKSGNRMLNTINDIVDISKIEAGQVEVLKKKLSINKLLDEQFNFFVQEAEAKGLELIYKPLVTANESIIISDQHKLESILTNLIKNAIKYTESGSIIIGYAKKTIEGRNFYEFYVKDTGIGIPEERIDAIFNRFEQADIEDNRAFEGSGLGLAISKSYVEMLGGKIDVSSKEGSGSSFTFTIPHIMQDLEERISKQNNEKESGASLKNLSVIVAEDDDVSKMLLKTILENELGEIIYTSTGKETIEKCRENPDTDIILMDLKMPFMNGYDATREIRKFNQNVIIIAQTAHGLTEDKERAFEAGCDDYIAKPIKKESLLEKIEVCVNKKVFKVLYE